MKYNLSSQIWATLICDSPPRLIFSSVISLWTGVRPVSEISSWNIVSIILKIWLNSVLLKTFTSLSHRLWFQLHILTLLCTEVAATAPQRAINAIHLLLLFIVLLHIILLLFCFQCLITLGSPRPFLLPSTVCCVWLHVFFICASVNSYIF